MKLPKLKEVKAKLHRDFSGQIKSATVSQVPGGKYYVSMFPGKSRLLAPLSLGMAGRADGTPYIVIPGF